MRSNGPSPPIESKKEGRLFLYSFYRAHQQYQALRSDDLSAFYIAELGISSSAGDSL